MIDSLDREARRLGVTRPSVIEVWLAERLEATASKFPLQPAGAGAARRGTLRWHVQPGKCIHGSTDFKTRLRRFWIVFGPKSASSP